MSGGTPPYNVTWSSLLGYTNNGVSISNLPDIYTATITDANNCGPLYETVSISEPSEITIYGVSSDVSCFGNDDGSIDLTTNNWDSYIIGLVLMDLILILRTLIRYYQELIL